MPLPKKQGLEVEFNPLLNEVRYTLFNIHQTKPDFCFFNFPCLWNTDCHE